MGNGGERHTTKTVMDCERLAGVPLLPDGEGHRSKFRGFTPHPSGCRPLDVCLAIDKHTPATVRPSSCTL